MKHSEKNRDPERARKRAVADLRCAVRKLGTAAAIEILREMVREERGTERLDSPPGRIVFVRTGGGDK